MVNMMLKKVFTIMEDAGEVVVFIALIQLLQAKVQIYLCMDFKSQLMKKG